MKLYEIDRALEEALEKAFDPETGEILNEDAFADLEALEAARVDKLEACAIMVKQYAADAEAIKAEIKALTQRARVASNKADSLKAYMERSIAPGEAIKTPRVAIGWRRSEGVAFDESFDVRTLPEELTKTTVEPNKTAIKAALKQGETVPGAFLETRQNLQIR